MNIVKIIYLLFLVVFFTGCSFGMNNLDGVTSATKIKSELVEN